MPGKVFELDEEGVLETILKADYMLKYLDGMAAEFAAQCGKGYGHSAYNKGRARCNASVSTNSSAARKDNLRNNTLLKVTGC